MLPISSRCGTKCSEYLKKVEGLWLAISIQPSQVPEEYRNDPVAIAECWAGSVTREEYLEQLNHAGFKTVKIIEESAPYEKGKVMVSSWTITSEKPHDKCNCKN